MIAYRRNKVYYSDLEGSYIKHAITGEILPWKVGSYDEKRLFKVKDNSLSSKFDTLHQNGHTMFYRNPEEYMKFNNVELDDEIIESWISKQEIFRK